MKTGRLVLGALLLGAGVGALASACASADSETGSETQGVGGTAAGVCEPGEPMDCQCMGGDGIQFCLEDGSGFGPCNCGSGGAGGYDPCGDDFCDQTIEDCWSCEADCPPCAPCDIAPNCDGAMIAPAELEHKTELDVTSVERIEPAQIREWLAQQVSQGTGGMRVLAAALDPEARPDEPAVVARLRAAFGEHPAAAEAILSELERAGMLSPRDYRDLFVLAVPKQEPPKVMSDEFPGGTLECGSPLLRVGIARVVVHDAQDWGPEEDEMYCLIESEAQSGAEVRVTPLVTGLADEGGEHLFSNEAGVFWGTEGPKTPGSDLLITYNCVENDDSAAYQALVEAIGNGAGDVGDVYDGAYGWVFPVVEGVAGIVGAAMAANGEDPIFNAQQQLVLDIQLDLTNGRWWSVRKGGGSFPSSWDWELIIRAWGCAEHGTL